MNKILVLKGDGIGPEIVEATQLVMDSVKTKLGLAYEWVEGDFGGAAYDKYGQPFPEETKALLSEVQAVLLGSVGNPRYDNLPLPLRPESALLEIRKRLGLYANIRPILYYDFLRDMVAIKEEVAKGTDIVILRELTGGIYFGEKGRKEDSAYDVMTYQESEIRRIVKDAFELASKRERKHLTSIDKANVLETSRLWRAIVEEEAKHYPQVEVVHLYVDNAAMQLIINPRQFDVIVTENSFGDILSDEAAALAGSLGMLPSASLGGEVSLFEPAHGSAPDLAGKDVANPVATILSGALLFRFALQNEEAAIMIENAVKKTLMENIKTEDIADDQSKVVGTKAFAEEVIKRL